MTSRPSIDRAIKYAVEGGFRTLFVQAVGRGDAFYNSSILPASELLDGDLDFDPLHYFLEQAHKEGLEVHVWVNLLYIWSSPRMPESPKHVVHRHSEWMVESYNGLSADHKGIENYSGRRDHDLFLSPAIPEVRAFLVAVITEIIGKYPVDGIHLDYIRYPSKDSGFEGYAKEAFFNRFNIDPVDLFASGKDGEKRLDPPSQLKLRSEWYRWRARQVTDLLREIRNVRRDGYQEVTLSAAVIPGIDRAHDIYGQDWVRWINEGILDIVVMMSYSPNTKVVLAQTREARRVVRNGRLYVGVATYNQPLEKVLNCVRKLRDLGVDGISVFSYNSMLKDPESFKLLGSTFLEAAPSTSVTP